MKNKEMHKLSLCLVFFFGIMSVSFGQTQQINFTQSDDHVAIPGTQYLIIPPDDKFAFSKLIHGIEGENKSYSINFTEMPMPFETAVPMFAKDMPDLTEEKDFIVNGNNVKIYKTEQLVDPDNKDSAMKFWMMLYGNEEVTILLGGTYETAKDEAFSPKFESSLLSFIYAKDKEVDPQDGLGFSFDLSDTPLKFVSTIMQTGAVYNLNGEKVLSGGDKTSYMVMVMPIEIEKAEQKDQAIRGVKRPFDEHITVEEVNPIALDGLEGYEVVAYEENENEEKTLKYSVALFDAGMYYDIRAASEIDLEKRLEMFKKLSRTFQLK